MESTDRLYRSKSNKVIGGVAAGLADYFNIDVVLARVAFVLLAMFGGGGVLIYIVMWIIVPAQTRYFSTQNSNAASSDEGNNPNQDKNSTGELVKPRVAKNSNTGLITGIVLIFVGLLFLIDRLIPWYNIIDFWPLLLVVVGVIMIKPDIFKPTKKESDEI